MSNRWGILFFYVQRLVQFSMPAAKQQLWNIPRPAPHQTQSKHTDLWVRCASGVRSVCVSCAFDPKLLRRRLLPLL